MRKAARSPVAVGIVTVFDMLALALNRIPPFFLRARLRAISSPRLTRGETQHPWFLVRC